MENKKQMVAIFFAGKKIAEADIIDFHLAGGNDPTSGENFHVFAPEVSGSFNIPKVEADSIRVLLECSFKDRKN